MSDICGALPGSALETLGHPLVSQSWDKRVLRGAAPAGAARPRSRQCSRSRSAAVPAGAAPHSWHAQHVVFIRCSFREHLETEAELV